MPWDICKNAPFLEQQMDDLPRTGLLSGAANNLTEPVIQPTIHAHKEGEAKVYELTTGHKQQLPTPT